MTSQTASYIASLRRAYAKTSEPGKRSELRTQLALNGVDPDAREEPKAADPVPERHTTPRETMEAPTVRRGRGRKS